MNTVDPRTFLSQECLGKVLSIVQFGSSIHTPHPGDIDLCVVTKKGNFFEFLLAKPFASVPASIDVSLVREEEI
ncbi:MAG: hypothetical protein KGI03_03475, partial [Patescibacteria group bacterium]|nr:hypothetical protein [Patescibacteria group bacterium]